MTHVKQLYKMPILQNLTTYILIMLTFLTCDPVELLAEKPKKSHHHRKAKDPYDLILDKVEDLIWECAKEHYPDLAVSLSSAIINYPFLQIEDSVRFLEIRSKMYLQTGDDHDYLLDKNLYLKKLSQINKAS